MPNEIREMRYASYIIPVRIKNGKKEFAVLEYRSGEYGTIGGRFEDYENDAQTVLRRELTEELDPVAAKKLVETAIQIPEAYSFKVAPERVAFRAAHNEVHYFFVAKIPDDLEIKFCEKCDGNVHIVWFDTEKLVNGEVIKFQDMLEYFEKNIMPIIRKM